MKTKTISLTNDELICLLYVLGKWRGCPPYDGIAEEVDNPKHEETEKLLVKLRKYADES